MTDFDLTKLSVSEAYELYESLRSRCPVAHSSANGGHYLLTRRSDVMKAAVNWKTFSSARGGVGLRPAPAGAPILPAINQDPPDHTIWRKLYTDAVTPAALKLVEPQIVAIADKLIDAFAHRGEADLVPEYAEVLPVLGISSVIGLTDKDPVEIREMAFEIIQALQSGRPDDAFNGRFSELVLAEVLGRRKNPKDDYLTQIAHAEIDGCQMNESEIVLFMVGFLVAGHESTTSALASLLYHVLSRPDLRERVMQDAKALDAAIEESVRITSPFHGFSRTVTEETEVDGIAIPAGSRVRLGWAPANRDPTVFKQPGVFDIDRPSNPHLGFGAGRHSCAGAPFARLEMRIALRQLLLRLPDLVVTQDQMDWHFMASTLALPEHLTISF